MGIRARKAYIRGYAPFGAESVSSGSSACREPRHLEGLAAGECALSVCLSAARLEMKSRPRISPERLTILCGIILSASPASALVPGATRLHVLGRHLRWICRRSVPLPNSCDDDRMHHDCTRCNIYLPFRTEFTRM